MTNHNERQVKVNRFITACFRFLTIPLTLGVIPILFIITAGWDAYAEWITADDL